MKTYAELKARHRAEREGWPQCLSLRVHRALSWLDRAERCEEDLDGRFLFLWIAFNAAYASELGSYQSLGELGRFRDFIRRLVELDDATLYGLVWDEYSGSIRTLLDNRFVFGAFWDFQRGDIGEDEFQQRFNNAKESAHRALARQDTGAVLVSLFSRLYVLRNQLVHGGATWNSGVNRDQVSDGANIMSKLVPHILTIMMDHPGEDWGSPSYPVVT